MVVFKYQLQNDI